MTKLNSHRIKKALILCSFFALLSTGLNTIASTNSNPQKALDTVLAKQCWFSGTFTQEKSLKGLPIPLTSDGQFLFDCERGLIWHTATPIIETKIYSLSSNHFDLNEKREIDVLDDVIQTTIAKMLLNIMSANTEAIANNFEITSADSNSVALIPNSGFIKKGIQSITLQKDLEQNALTITLLDNQSQNTRIHSIETYKSESKSASLSHCQSLFNDAVTCDIFDKPSSYETVAD